jgi:hypothetical protein
VVKSLCLRTPQFLIASLGLFIAILATPSDCVAQKLVDVSAQVTVTKSGLVLNRATNTFNCVVTITNTSASDLNGPLLLVISKLSPTTVTLANQSGQDPSGDPYVSLTVPPDGLIAGGRIANILLEFHNPSRVAFTFTVSLSTIEIQPEALPAGVTGPLIESVPPAAAVVGSPMQYQVVASSAVPASLTYSLSTPPAGMTIGAITGLMQWTPAATEAGDQPVIIVAQDSEGQTSQSFTLSVFGSAPVMTVTIPAVRGGVITVTDPGSSINGLTISIPAGALTTDTTFTVSVLTQPPTLAGTPRFFMTGFSISPDGISLASPATVKLPYNPSQFGTQQGIALEAFLGAYFIQASTGKLQFLNTFSVDKVNHVLTATVPHFSSLEFLNIARLCPPPITGSLCGDSYAPGSTSYPPSLLIPAVMVHGFVLPYLNGGLGDESTWGQLRTLLGGLDSGNSGRIDAWRFDWDSFRTPFETSAANLDTSLAYIESVQQSPVVNIVAHSFGGILSRTYLAGLGIGQAAYGYDVNRIMTIGTPHTGIGGNLSTILASFCAAQAQYDPFSVTCFEAGTGQQALVGGAVGEGNFLRKLNSIPLPGPPGGLGALPPWFMHIKGQTLNFVGLTGVSLHADDGLITTAGAKLCGGSPVDVCSGVSVQDTEVIAASASDRVGLCHTETLLGITCSFQSTPFGPNPNVAMAAVNDTSHPLWGTICSFLGCKPAINVTLSDPSAGTVTSDPKGINCGPSCNPPGIDCGSSCTALFDSGTTVTLTETPSAGHIFVGWSGDCSGTAATCVLTIADDHDHLQRGYQVSAVFSEPAGLTLDSASCTEASNVVSLADGTPFPYRTFTCVFSGSVFGPANTELAVGGPTAFYCSSTTGCQPADFHLYAIPPEVFMASPPSYAFTCGSWSPIPPQYRGSLFPPGTTCIRGGTSDQGPRTTWSVTSTFDTFPPPGVSPFVMALNAFTTDFSGTPNSVTRYISTDVVPF